MIVVVSAEMRHREASSTLYTCGCWNERIETFVYPFEYDYENWTSDGGTTSGQGGAYYATSTFVVVKSNTPIVKPTVTN